MTSYVVVSPPTSSAHAAGSIYADTAGDRQVASLWRDKRRDQATKGPGGASVP